MCGLVGILGPETSAPHRWVESMAGALRHRGPDDSATWTTRYSDDGGAYEVALGHTRLSIIDLSPLGRQPMTSPDGQVAVVYNGEIYNYRELRAELAAGGFSFKSQSDTEVALAAYLCWGAGSFARLEGMFAIGIWDGRSGTLYLVRDRLGIKPLLYQSRGGSLLFASELAALRCHGQFEPAIDPAALSLFLRYGYVPAPRSIYLHTRKVMPGQYVTWRGGALASHTYWSLFEKDAATPSERGEQVRQLESIVRRAVHSRMVADVPVGAFLSGGLDSSVVAALMQEASSRPVQTFTVGFDDPAYDESAKALAVARHLGTEHHVLRADRAATQGVIRDLALAFDEPFGDESAVPVLLVSRLARQHVKVALTGDGGDELFGGYSRYARLALLQRLYEVPGFGRRVMAALGRWVPHRGTRNFSGLLGVGQLSQASSLLTSRFAPGLTVRACNGMASVNHDEYIRAFEAAPFVGAARRAMFADCHTYLPDDILVKLDRATMSVGLEGRVPLLDHRLVRFALSLPAECPGEPRQPKALLRAVAGRLLPSHLVGRSKQGFGFPLASLLAEEIPEWTKRYLDPRRLHEEGNLDPDAVAAMVAATSTRSKVAIKGLWNLLCFQRWFAAVHRGEAI